ncbi:MAG: cytochrome c maturation protein CcmE [Rhodothermales bacterium]
MKIKNILALALGIVFVGVLFMNFGSSVGGYMDFQEAQASGSSAHVVGTWANDHPINYDPQTNTFTFHMRDENGTLLKVEYPNPKPANFEDAEKLVIEGKIKGDVFAAEHILVKCPSKYNDTNVMGT